jgi:hypothetical protein
MPRHVLLTVALITSAFALTSCRDDWTPTGSPPGPNGEGGRGAEGFQFPGEVRTGYIRGPRGNPVKVTFEVHGGQAILEGDIILGPASEIATTPEQLRAKLRHGAEGPSFAS